MLLGFVLNVLCSANSRSRSKLKMSIHYYKLSVGNTHYIGNFRQKNKRIIRKMYALALWHQAWHPLSPSHPSIYALGTDLNVHTERKWKWGVTHTTNPLYLCPQSHMHVELYLFISIPLYNNIIVYIGYS